MEESSYFRFLLRMIFKTSATYLLTDSPAPTGTTDISTIIKKNGQKLK
ncbi:hypothetical protein GACE_2273 [Geoglobus acetivorans]|uniref:Uncharacterized protein n=1 Tax=Geoglobus acetivorans TaxID=565033 RepID=A0A0A7GCP9_GEOAI|nr:hypothetical protein GACE_2273 [Geoglobus acetivorans]